MSTETETIEVKINKWDSCAVKNALDDAVRDIFTLKLKYIEDNKLMDGRLIISAVAVAVAMFALLYDYFYPFPQSRTILIICVISYFVTMFLLTLYVNYVEKGIFVRAIQRDPTGFDPNIYWEASSNLKKYDDMYSLTLVSKCDNFPNPLQATITKSVANFFDEEGMLVREILEKKVIALRDSLEPSIKNN